MRKVILGLLICAMAFVFQPVTSASATVDPNALLVKIQNYQTLTQEEIDWLYWTAYITEGVPAEETQEALVYYIFAHDNSLLLTLGQEDFTFVNPVTPADPNDLNMNLLSTNNVVDRVHCGTEFHGIAARLNFIDQYFFSDYVAASSKLTVFWNDNCVVIVGGGSERWSDTTNLGTFNMGISHVSQGPVVTQYYVYGNTIFGALGWNWVDKFASQVIGKTNIEMRLAILAFANHPDTGGQDRVCVAGTIATYDNFSGNVNRYHVQNAGPLCRAD